MEMRYLGNWRDFPDLVEPMGRSALAAPTRRETLSAEICHRISTSLQVVMSFTREAERRVRQERTSEAAIAAIEGLQARVAAIAAVQRLLVSAPDHNWATAEMLMILGKNLWTIHARPGVKLVITEITDIPARMSQSAGLILCELMTNALRHGFDADDEGEVCVSIRIDGQKLLLEVIDTGRGFLGEPHARPGHGISLVHDLAEQDDGKAERLPLARGAGWRVTLPVRD